MPEETITISRQKFDDLMKSSRWVRSLEAAGVDNWDGCHYAYKILVKNYPQYKDPDEEDEEE